MSIELVSLQFIDIDPSAAFAPLLRARGSTPVRGPEWTANAIDPQESPLALILNRLTAAPAPTFLVRVVIARTGAETEVVVKADDARLSHPALKIPPVTVKFGVSDHRVTKDIECSYLGTRQQVSARNIKLRWRVTPAGTESWKEFGQSFHRLYTILAEPGPPWSITPSERKSWLWTDVLDLACAKAAGANTPEESANMITQWLFSLGMRDAEGTFKYAGGARFTSLDAFDCSLFLSALGDRPAPPDRGPYYVNCSDFASAVSTLANALGCSLRQGRIARTDSQEMRTNKIRMIGHDATDNETFIFHEVAWDREPATTGRVWDGVCQLDADEDPASLPIDPFLPAGVPFNGVYGRSLLDPESLRVGQPDGSVPRNRELGPIGAPVQIVSAQQNSIVQAMHATALTPELRIAAVDSLLFGGPVLNVDLPGLGWPEDFAQIDTNLYFAKWLVEGSTILCDVFTAPDNEAAVAWMKYRLLSVALRMNAVADVQGFAVACPGTATYVAGNLALFAQNEPESMRELTRFIRAIDALLMKVDETAEPPMALLFDEVPRSVDVKANGGFRLQCDRGALALKDGVPHYLLPATDSAATDNSVCHARLRYPAKNTSTLLQIRLTGRAAEARPKRCLVKAFEFLNIFRSTRQR